MMTSLEFLLLSSLRRGEIDLDRDLDLRFLAFLASFFSFLAFLSAFRRFFSNNSLICKSRIFLSYTNVRNMGSKSEILCQLPVLILESRMWTNLLSRLYLQWKDALEYIPVYRWLLEFVELYHWILMVYFKNDYFSLKQAFKQPLKKGLFEKG